MRSLEHREAKTAFAWKKAPFGRYRRVPPYIGERWPVYERKPIRSALRRDWLPEEVDRLHDLIAAGKSYDKIAQDLGRSRDAVIIKLKRSKAPRLFKHPTVLTAREVGRLLGLTCSKRVAYWAQHGWLIAQVRHSAVANHSLWAIQYDDLVAFLRNPEYWTLWDPQSIADCDLRQEMEELRARQPRWLSTAEVARRFRVEPRTVSSWVKKRQLQGQKINNRLMIRESELEGWVVPCERARPRRQGFSVTEKAERK